MALSDPCFSIFVGPHKVSSGVGPTAYQPSIKSAIEKLHLNAHKIQIPVLIAHGTKVSTLFLVTCAGSSVPLTYFHCFNRRRTLALLASTRSTRPCLPLTAHSSSAQPFVITRILQQMQHETDLQQNRSHGSTRDEALTRLITKSSCLVRELEPVIRLCYLFCAHFPPMMLPLENQLPCRSSPGRSTTDPEGHQEPASKANEAVTSALRHHPLRICRACYQAQPKTVSLRS